MRSVIFGTLMALTVTVATAAEDTDSANYMLPACKRFVDQSGFSSNVSAFEEGKCAGVIGTVAFMAQNADVGLTALSGEGVETALKRRWRCSDIPASVTRGQEVRVVIRYIEARPNRMHEPFRSLALEALLDAWPCRN
jgi:hypothetical protein